METKFKVLIGIGSTLTVGTGVVLGYRFWKSKQEDNLSLEIGTVDWKNKIIPFKILNNGKVFIDEKINWTKDNLGKEFGYIKDSKGKNELWGSNLQNGLVLVAKSLGKNKSGKIIDFGSKTIKDYNGTNLSKDIAGANAAITNLFF